MKKLTSLLLVVLMLLCMLTACDPDAEEIDWINIKLGHVLPQPQSNLMEIVSNDDEKLLVYIHEISQNQFLEYQRWCEEEKGFNIESETMGNSFEAYNQEGYHLLLSYLSSQGEMHITLETPIPMETFELPEYAVVAGLPIPTSSTGHYSWQNNDSFSLYVGETTREDYFLYKDACVEAGFTEDPYEYNTVYSATNAAGHKVSLNYKGFNIFTLEFSSAKDSGEETTDKDNQNSVNQQTEPVENTAPSIAKGTEYAYMTDEWNVYIATAISSDIIKIENWSKVMSNAKSVSHDYDVGTFKISDSENEFAWIDEEHTTFQITFTDKNNSKFKKGNVATFTININDSDNNKGSNYSEDIACFAYENDDWHLYRAIPLTETLIKIECWTRSSSVGTYLFGYDWCLIDTLSGDTDFAWTDDEHTSFAITTKDEENSFEWRKESFVLFVLENEDYTHFDVKSYLGKWEVGEGEVAVPAASYEFKYDNYEDVQKELEDAGFTNITTSVLYDIFWGLTEEGEVDSVSIDGKTRFEEGEVFSKDAPVVITYHMKEEDDPNKESNSNTSESEEARPVFYSTNDYETAKKGNTGVFSYRDRGNFYDIYWIIDFDEGYVYYFTDGNGETFCDRLKIESGTLNDAITITYHDGGDVWSNKLHFKYVDHPETLIVVDHNGFGLEYSTTDLDDALAIRDTKNIKDY